MLSTIDLFVLRELILTRLFDLVALDATVQNDPKYKKYAQQVEKCLASFETMHEWPDFIAFLKQLLKVYDFRRKTSVATL